MKSIYSCFLISASCEEVHAAQVWRVWISDVRQPVLVLAGVSLGDASESALLLLLLVLLQHGQLP